tara:strand:- start:98 stop:685 length:588 start_codon:yes stop_codon:yes gene_type:complete
MKDYSKGKIYKVISNNNDKLYIGSTIQTLCSRMNCHRRKRGDCSSSLLGNMKDCYMVLIANYPSDNREILLMEEERYYQLYKKNGFDVVNKNSPYTTKEQKKEQKKKWREDNKERNNIKSNKWNNEHKEHLKKYYQENKDKLKKWREDNKEENKQKRKDKIQETIHCICGVIIQKRGKNRHEKSIKHIKHINETA